MGYQGNKNGFDGIPVGTLRFGYSDLDPERWCKCFGHKWRESVDGKWCLNCFKSEKEIESGKEEKRP